jgi:lipid A 3-O-deacylase
VSLRRALALATAALLLSAVPSPPPAAAQALRAAELRVDNDSFNFWIPSRRRPDTEYTHGASLTLGFDGAPSWAARLLGTVAPDSAPARRLRTDVRIGQEIYNSRIDADVTLEGQRPYAGWLYAAGSVRRVSAESQRTVSLQVGTTGPPSQGAAIQTAWHRRVGYRNPKGWGDQLPAEPGVVVGYREHRLLTARVGGGPRVADLAPYAGVLAGNIRTEAEVGARARIGVGLAHPWAGDGRRPPPIALYVTGAIRQRAVLRDVFLDGSTFRESPRVDKHTFVAAAEAGAGVRVWGVAVEYAAHTRGRAYRTEPSGHSYGTLSLRMH